MKLGMTVSLVFTIGLVAVLLCSPVVAQRRNEPGLNSTNSAIFRSLPAPPLSVDGTEVSGLTILSSLARQASGEQFAKLTQSTAEFPEYLSLPSVTIMNDTNKAVTGFNVVLYNSTSHEMELYRKTLIRLQPGDQFTVDPLLWAMVRNGAAHRYIRTGDSTKREIGPAGWNSLGAWVPGRLSDFQLVITQVDFEDGTHWVTKR